MLIHRSLYLLEGEPDGGAVAVADPPEAPTDAPVDDAPKSDAAPSDEASASSSEPVDVWERMQAAGVTPEALDEMVRALPVEERSKLTAWQEARQDGSAEALQQEEAARKAQTERDEAWGELSQQGQIAERWIANRLKRAMDDPDTADLKPTELAPAIRDYAAGRLADAAKDAAKLPEKMQERYADTLGELSADEKRQLKEARHKDAKAGSNEEQVFALADILASRRAEKAEAKGEKKGERTAANALPLLDTIARIAEANANGAPKVKGGVPGKKHTWADIQKMNKQQLDALPEGEFERAMNEG